MQTNMKALRKKRGLTQEQLADRINATQRQVGAWERGENELTIDFANAIANELGCSLNELVGIPSPETLDCAVNDDERELLRLYRMHSDESRHAVLAFLRALAK